MRSEAGAFQEAQEAPRGQGGEAEEKEVQEKEKMSETEGRLLLICA